MKLIRAYTADAPSWGPVLILELAGNPPAVVDVEQKRSLIGAGVAILFPLGEDDELSGFEDVTVRIDRSDPQTEITIEASRYSAPTRDPRILDLARQFFEAVDGGIFRPGIQLYPPA